jgi:hypothetical protein
MLLKKSYLGEMQINAQKTFGWNARLDRFILDPDKTLFFGDYRVNG